MEGQVLDLYYKICWKPGTLNRIENNFFEILTHGYDLTNIKSEIAFSLDMADLNGVVQDSYGHCQEKLERDPLAIFDPSYGLGWGPNYFGYFIVFNDVLNKRIRSENYLSDSDIENIMNMIQPDRAKPFRRRIYTHLCTEDKDGCIGIWPEVMDYLQKRGITVSHEKNAEKYLVSAFLSAAIGIYQIERVLQGANNLIY